VLLTTRHMSVNPSKHNKSSTTIELIAVLSWNTC